LVDPRIQLHWAAQIVASVGATYLDPVPDDSHPNMEWLASHRVLAGNPTPGGALRGALNLSDFSLSILDATGETKDSCVLAGKTVEEGYGWMEAALRAASGGGMTKRLERDRYEVPDHGVRHGRPFDGSATEAFAEVSRWFDNSDLVLREHLHGVAGATTVRCWPHHFDIGALIVLDPDGDPESARSVGIGMTPGDGSYAEPYWYVNPWPRPDPSGLPDLAAPFHWHREGWIGAVLTGHDLVAAGDGVAQRELTTTYLRAATDANRRILGTD
jgi:hypothetical protein